MGEELKSQKESHHHHHRRSRRFWPQSWRKITHIPRRRFYWVVIGMLIYAVGFAIYLGYSTIERVKQGLDEGQWQLEQAVATLSSKSLSELSLLDLEDAEQHLLRAESAFLQAQTDVKPYIPFLSILGGDASALPHLIDTALNISQAGRGLYEGLEPLLSLLLDNPQNPALTYKAGAQERIIAPLLAGQPRFVDARDHLSQALTASQKIDRAQLSDETARVVDEIDSILPRLYSLADTLVNMPDLLNNLLGRQEQKTYLVLSQNNDELRPTGGFISTFGVLVVKDGQIANYEYRPTSPPNLTPPAEECPVKSPPWWIQLQDPVWGCWDAQWTADFPTLAQQAEWFYENGDNLFAPVDGVIAIDMLATETLLGALGEVEVPDYGEVVDAENMRERIYYYRAQEGDQPHKQFIASMFKAIIGDLVKVPPEKTPLILDALWTSMQEKHLLFYFDSPDLESLATILGADGSILPSQGDYLFVVDSSLTNKGYSSIDESITYEAIINPDGSMLGGVTLTWSYPADAVQNDPAIAEGIASGTPPDFLDFARIYIPKGSVWSGTDGNDSPTQFAEEMDKLMFGNQFALAPGANMQIQHHYLLPNMIQKVGERFYYCLLVQKQPGTRAHELIVRVALPPGAMFLTSKPEADSVRYLSQTVIEFQAQLLTDQTFEVVFIQ